MQGPRRNFKDLTLAQLRTFCVVARLGGYAAAARELLLSGPAVWEQMQGLERHYGRGLLVRRGNGIALTVEGQQLLEMARPLLAGIDSMREAVQQRSGALPAAITVATNLRVLAEEISRGLRDFQRRHAAIRLRLIFTGNDVEERVANGEADVGLTLEQGPDEPRWASAAYEPVAEVDYLLITPRGHALLRGRQLKLSQIADFPLVLGEAAAYSRRRVQEVLHRHDLTGSIRLAVETSSDEYTLSCVRAGLGVGITVGTGRGQVYRGLGVRSLRRWFGTARVGFLWTRGGQILETQRELAKRIGEAVRRR